MRLPYFSGSAWRGLLGHSLRGSVCVTRAHHCDGCLLRGQCVYARFFETPPLSAEQSRRYSALPHPFVLEPPPAGACDYAPGDPLALGITLIGPGRDLPAYLIHTMQRAGERGLGRIGGRFQLLTVTQERETGSEDWQCLFDSADGRLHSLPTPPPATPPQLTAPLELQLLTPLRLKWANQFVSPDKLDTRMLLGALVARISLLQELYSDASHEAAAPAVSLTEPVKQAIDQVRLEPTDLTWVDWTRWSSRQATHMQLGGLLGALRLRGPGLDPLWPMIWLGQWIHLGKQSSFGLGRYRVKPAPTAPKTE